MEPVDQLEAAALRFSFQHPPSLSHSKQIDPSLHLPYLSHDRIIIHESSERNRSTSCRRKHLYSSGLTFPNALIGDPTSTPWRSTFLATKSTDPSWTQTFRRSGLVEVRMQCTATASSSDLFFFRIPKRILIPLRGIIENAHKRIETDGVTRLIGKPSRRCAGITTCGYQDKRRLRYLSDSDVSEPIYAARTLHLAPCLRCLDMSRWRTESILKKGCNQNKLAKENQNLTTLMTPFGMFQFNRPAIEISSAPEIF